MKAFLEGFICILFLIHTCRGQDFRTPIGNPCNQSDECATNSECVTSFCQCQSGYSATPALECKVNYDGNCIEDNDCNVRMGHRCIKSVCQCSDPLEQTYVHEIGGCINSTTKLMYDQILDIVNQTEHELMKFTTLLHLFMAHGSGGGFQQDTSASDVAPETYSSLQDIEDQFRSAQSVVPVVVPPATTDVKKAVPEAKAQEEGPQITQVLPSPSPSPGIGSQLPNSFGNLILPIIPNSPNRQTVNGGVFVDNQQLDSLANVLPSLLNMFKQFLPFLQSFNGVLGSSVMNENSRQQGGQVNPSLFGGSGGPGGLLQIPGRIFNTFFGRNSTINQIKRRIIPFDFTNKAIPFLPWPLG